MIFFSHSSRIRILQLTFPLVCSCSEGLLTTEKHHLVPFCLLIFCILCVSIQIKYFFFLDTQGTELKHVFHLLRLFYRQDRSSLPVSYKVVHIDLSLSPICDYLDVGDLTEIIFTFIIFYCFKFSEGSQSPNFISLEKYGGYQSIEQLNRQHNIFSKVVTHLFSQFVKCLKPNFF